MDELAHTIGMDPLEFRLKNLKNGRLHAARLSVTLCPAVNAVTVASRRRTVPASRRRPKTNSR